MRSSEARNYREHMLDGETESALREQYPDGTVVSVFIDDEWKLARISGEVSIKDKQFAAQVLLENVMEKNTPETRFDDEEYEELTDKDLEAGEYMIPLLLKEIEDAKQSGDDFMQRGYEEELEKIRQEKETGKRLKQKAAAPAPSGPHPNAIPILLKHPPTKVDFAVNPRKDFSQPGMSGIDASKNASLIVTEANVTDDGSIEYTVQAVKGDTYKHIPQELLSLWRDVARLEHNLQNLEKRIQKKVLLSLRADLLARVTDAQKLVDEAKDRLPNFSEMRSHEKEQVEYLAEQLHRVHRQAREAISELEINVQDVIGSGADIATVPHLETESEKQARATKKEKQEKKERTFIESFEAELDNAAKKEVAKIDEEEKRALNKLIAEKKSEFEQAHPQQQGQQGGQGRGPKFDPSSVSLPPDVKADFEEQRKQKRKEVFLRMFVNRAPTTDTTQERFYDRLEELRKELYQKDRTKLPGDMNSSDDDYIATSDKFGSQTYHAYEILAKEWKHEPKEEEKKEVDEFAFSFDSLQNLTFRAEDLLGEIPKEEATGMPVRDFEDVYDRLRIFVRDARKDYEHYSLPLEKLNPPFNDSIALAAQRVVVYEKYVNQLHELRTELVKKLHATKEKTVEKKEAKNEFIDIPEEVLRESLFRGPRLVDFKHAMQGVYEDVFASAALTGATIEQFKKLVPAKADSALLETLRPYGIKNWEQFKNMWDEHVAPKFAESARVSADAKFKSKVAEKITWYKKAWKLKGDIAVRVATTAVLVGGASWLAGMAAAGMSAFWATTTVLGGGAVGGGVRGWLNKAFFGSEKAKAKAQDKMKELYGETAIASKDDIVRELLDEQFGGSGDKTDYTQAASRIDLLPQLTAVMAEVVREVSIEQDAEQPEEVRKLTPDARALYERALKTLEPKERTEQVRRDLAIAISKVGANGDRLEKAAYEGGDPAVMQAMGSLYGGISGKKGIGYGALTGSALTGAFMYDRMAGAGAVGFMGGAVATHEVMKGREAKERRDQARSKLVADLNAFVEGFKKYKDPASHINFDNPDEVQTFIDTLAQYHAFKDILHGSVLREYAPALIVDKKQDQFGALVADRDALLSQIKSVIHDVERTRLLEQRPESQERQDANRMRALLHRLQESHKELDQRGEANLAYMTKELEKESKRWTRKRIFATIGGGLAGAGAAILVGHYGRELFKSTHEWMQNREKPIDIAIPESKVVSEQPQTATETAASSSDVAGASSPAESASTTTDSASVEPKSILPEDLPPNPELEAQLEKQASAFINTEKPNLIKSGQGTIHALNRLEAGGRYSILGEVDQNNWSPEQTEAWNEMQKDFDEWKNKQLEEMGYRWVNGKLGGPLSLRAGDEMKLFWDAESGEWKARFVRFEYDEGGGLKYETNEDGTFKLDKNRDKIPVDKFKGRVSDKLLFTGKESGGPAKGAAPKTLGEEVADWEKSIEAVKNTPSGKANTLLENVRQLDPDYQSDVEQVAERAKLAEQVRARVGYDPYNDPKLSDGYGPMPERMQQGEPTEDLKMLRTSPEIIDSLMDTDDPLAAADDLQSFTEQYVKTHPTNFSSESALQKNVADFKSAWREHVGGGGDVAKTPEVAASKQAKMFVEDYTKPHSEEVIRQAANAGEKSPGYVDTSSEPLGFNAADLSKLSGPAANTDTELGIGAAANTDTEILADPESVGETPINSWESADRTWKVQFVRSGGEIEDMTFEGLPPNPQIVAESVLSQSDTINSIERDPEAAELFLEFAKYKLMYDELSQGMNLHTDAGDFVKMRMAELMDRIANELNADQSIFKQDLLEILGIGAVKKAA